MARVEAFTLAETLITIGLIGVVAAMTLPTVISTFQDKIAVARLKKAYSILENNYQNYITLEGDPTSWYLGDVSNYGTSEDYENSKGLAEVLTQKVQTVRVCGDKKGCFTKGYYKFTNGSQWNDSLDNGKHRYKLITIDGMSMAFHWYSRDCNRLDKNLEICGIVFVDIDGPRGGTATWGKDLYRFMLTKDRIIPDGDPRHAGDSFKKSECPKQGTQCAAWVIYNENRDYLKCKDLEWDKKSRCKEEKFNNLPK